MTKEEIELDSIEFMYDNDIYVNEKQEKRYIELCEIVGNQKRNKEIRNV